MTNLDRDPVRMGQPLFAVFVPGTPRPQGSKTYLGNGRMKESSQYLKAWRGLVSARASIAWKRTPPLDQPVHLEVVFVMPDRTTKPSPGAWHTVTPDLDKLLRAIGDALTAGGILRDDSRISAITATKRRARQGERAGAHITIHHLDTTSPATQQETPCPDPTS